MQFYLRIASEDVITLRSGPKALGGHDGDYESFSLKGKTM